MARDDNARRGAALVIGRFQPLHDGHLEAIRGIVAAHGKLVLLIGSAQASRTEKNPFTAEERVQMISGCLKMEGLLGKVRIRKISDEFDHEKWVAKVVSLADGARTLYSGNWLVQHLLKTHFKVRKMTSGVKISATEIRHMIRRGDSDWKKYVPQEIREYLTEKKLLKIV